MSHQEQGVEQSSQPTLCSAGCGFYSNSGPGGMCSKCSREAQAVKAASEKLGEKLASSSSSAVPNNASTTTAPCVQHHQPPATPVLVPVIAAAGIPVTSTSVTPVAVAVPSPSSAPSEASPASASAPPPPKPSSTRCLMCNKKVGLTGFSCKCNPEAVFCSAHRYAEAHACTFDYKAAQMKQLAENNPVVMAAKLNKF